MFSGKLADFIMRPKNKYRLKKADKFFLSWVPGYKLFSARLRAYAKELIYLRRYLGKDNISVDDLWDPIITKETASKLKVSIIVPNYNHEKYLEERLQSIYRQTYQNYEVILLDDCSTDNSRQILEKYFKQYSHITRLYSNGKGSGSAFKQWEKGMSLAVGDLVWIAESDDFCDEAFLETLVPAFADESVMLAFCRSDFIESGKKVFSTEQYLADITAFDWSKSFTVTGNIFVEKALAVKSVIPNVSSAVFRRRIGIPLELKNILENMRLCGDWAFYLDTIKGGCVFYSSAVTNYYRIHAQSTSLKIQGQIRYYEEQEKIACYIASNYKVPVSCHERHLKNLQDHYLSFGGGKDVTFIEKYFRLEKIALASERRVPNVLLCVFSMVIGGGETFPLFLANELRRQGVAVTIANFEMDEFNPAVRAMLDNDIPCVQLRAVGRLDKILVQFGIDVIHTHHGAVDEAVAYVLLKNKQYLKVKHAITLHGMYEVKDKYYLTSLLNKVKITCSAYIYIADKNLGPFKRYGYRDFSLFHKIGNGLPFYKGEALPRRLLDIPDDAFVLCIVSRAIPEKGWSEAAEAVTQARKISGKDIHLLLVGNGEMYNRMKGKVPTYIHLMGFRANVRDYFATADAGLLPSAFRGESFPLTIIDSLFCGKPVIASNIGEIKKQLTDKNENVAGMLFDLVDWKIPIDKLASIISELATDTELYEILQARTHSAGQKFYIDNVANKYLRIYEQMLKEN